MDPVQEPSVSLPSEERRAKPPSVSRDEATNAVVYRLSELMFGSLLAAYVLGFIGFAASEAQRATQGGLSAFYPAGVTYLCISVAFAYITAGLYISYHVSILTMPHLPLSRLRWDFLVALLQAVLFGVSMLSPPWFPLCLGCVLLAAIVRQYLEHQALADWFGEDILPLRNDPPVPSHSPRGNPSAKAQRKKTYRKLFKAVLQEVKPLSIWRPLPRSAWGASLLILAGIPLIYLSWLYEKEPLIHQLMAWISIVIFFTVILMVNSLLEDRGDFLYSEDAIKSLDTQFYKFYDTLKERVNSRD